MKEYIRSIGNKRENKKTAEMYRHELLAALQKFSKEVNEDCGVQLLADDGTVSMKHFGYSKEALEKDKQRMKDKEETWIRRDLKLDPQVEVTKEIRQDWEKLQIEKNKTRKSDLLEMVATLLLHKVIGKEYVIARASKYDDYFGFDNIIVHKATGAVICTFDDVHGRKEGETYLEKQREVIKSAKHGGATIKYGFTFKNGQLIKQQINHVPKLYMSFDMGELEDALEAVNVNDLSSVSEQEYKFFNTMISGFVSQLHVIKENSTDPELRKRVGELEELLPALQRL